MKKPKLSVSKQIKSVQLGASASKKPPSVLMDKSVLSAEKKNYKKTEQEPVNVSFGQTGLTGES